MKINKKYLIIGIVAIIAILAIIVILCCTQKEDIPTNRDYEEIAASNKLRVVTDYNSVGYFVSGDTIAGFNHELIQLLQKQIPFEIEVALESSLDKSIEGLKNGKYDVVIRNIPITSELRNSLIFTNSIAQNKQVLIQRKAEFNDGTEPIRSHLNLGRKTLHIPHNSPSILRIKNLSNEIGDTIYYIEDEVYEAEQLVMKVASKEIDYAVCDEKIAKQLALSLPEIDYSTSIGFTHLEAWAVRESSPVLLDSLNTWIEKIKKTRSFNTIVKKYYK